MDCWLNPQSIWGGMSIRISMLFLLPTSVWEGRYILIGFFSWLILLLENYVRFIERFEKNLFILLVTYTC